MLRSVRIACACVVFCAFVLLFTNPGGYFDDILGWLPKLQFWPAVLAGNVASLLLVLTLTSVLGRIYCSVLCPLGILQDAIFRIRISGKKKNRFTQKSTKALTWTRYCSLAVFLAVFCLGHASIAALVEPYSIFGRMISSLWAKTLGMAAISLVTLAIIAVLVWKYGRIWCNSICPVGTVLGFFSARSLFRPVIDTRKCNGCGLCAKGCRASCIDPQAHTIDMSRCVDCFDCIDNCTGSAIEYKFQLPKAAPSTEPEPATESAPSAAAEPATDGPQDNSRRAFISASALAAGSIAMKAQEGHGALGLLKERKSPQRATALVPAGATSLKHFSTHCVACQLCVDACPNHVLVPDTSLERFLQPAMSFEKGWCRPECNACSRVCPAGAIVKLEPEEKTAVSIGHAVYNPDLCVVKTDEVSCGNCARHCPSGAISMVKSAELAERRIPVVNPERCIGCGRCEYVCPSRPVSAIYVEGNLVHRSI